MKSSCVVPGGKNAALYGRRDARRYTVAARHLVRRLSPAKNPAMWTLPLFTNFPTARSAAALRAATYSRSTILRVTLLLAGFFVGVGHATGEKEETTIAAND